MTLLYSSFSMSTTTTCDICGAVPAEDELDADEDLAWLELRLEEEEMATLMLEEVVDELVEVVEEGCDVEVAVEEVVELNETDELPPGLEVST